MKREQKYTKQDVIDICFYSVKSAVRNINYIKLETNDEIMDFVKETAFKKEEEGLLDTRDIK